jgi:glucosamine--fructose-6-phosphate aminotransferase (isomerizing)
LHFGEIVNDATIIVLSRSGKSTEIVQLLDIVASRNIKVIAVTNTPDSPLAMRANVALKMMAAFDHAVSVSMYSVLAMVGALLAHSMRKPLDDSLGLELHNSISSVATSLSPWREQIRLSDWLDVRASYYLLGRGSSLASCHEGRLLWEEAAKLPASAMSTGSFRHGSQEVIREGFRIALWIDRERMRIQDLALADDLRRLGVKVLLIGQDLPRDAGDVVLRIPSIRREWQFLIDIIPIQLAAELLAHAGNQDCDTFRLCQYIVEDEGGIIHPDTGATGIAAPLQR